MPNSEEEDDDTVASYLVACWRIEGHAVCMRAEQVEEIVEIAELTPLPSADERVLGLASLRGGLLPIFSLAGELGLEIHAESLWLPFPAVLISVQGTAVGVPSDSLPRIERATEPLPTHGSLFELAGEVRTVFDATVLDEVLRSAEPDARTRVHAGVGPNSFSAPKKESS